MLSLEGNVIRKQDGTPYRLRGPNPLLRDQEIWDEVILHNMTHEEVAYHAKAVRLHQPSRRIVNQEIQITETEPGRIELPPQHPDTIFCHVLPFVAKVTVDEVTSERIIRPGFGETITMQVKPLVRDPNELMAVFLTAESVEAGSIVYVPVERRWWKVTRASQREDGFELACVVSDQTPSFR